MSEKKAKKIQKKQEEQVVKNRHENRKKHSKKKEEKSFNPIWLLLFLIPATAGAVYGGIKYIDQANYYVDKFYPNTSIGDLNIGGMTVEEVRNILTEGLDDYQLTIHQPDGDQVMTAEDIDRHLDITDSEGKDKIQSMMDAQDPMKWILEERSAHSYDSIDIVYDEGKVEKFIDKLNCVNPEEKRSATNAYINYDEDENRYEVVPAKTGNTVERKVASDAVYEALNGAAAEVEIPIEAFEQPESSDKDEAMNKFVDSIEQYLSAEITLQEGDNTVLIDRNVIIDFLDVDMENQTVELVEDKVKNYINTKLDATFDSIGRERTITTSLSGTFTIGGGTFGTVVSTADELPKLMEEIKTGTKTTRQPCFKNKDTSIANDGIGNSYVDVNLTKQTLLLVINGKEIMTSSFVSGCTKKKRGTPTGIYTVDIKARNYTMKKYNVFVRYWMNFNTAEGVGFHDASWRSKFGGTIYKYSGSHGCINMPSKKAKKLFNNLPYGTPVLVHY